MFTPKPKKTKKVATKRVDGDKPALEAPTAKAPEKPVTKVSHDALTAMTPVRSASDALAIQDEAFIFVLDKKEVLKFCPNGKAYVRGELVDSNHVLYEQVKSFFAAFGK